MLQHSIIKGFSEEEGEVPGQSKTLTPFINNMSIRVKYPCSKWNLKCIFLRMEALWEGGIVEDKIHAYVKQPLCFTVLHNSAEETIVVLENPWFYFIM